jgi:hypothetical protein
VRRSAAVTTPTGTRAAFPCSQASPRQLRHVAMGPPLQPLRLAALSVRNAQIQIWIWRFTLSPLHLFFHQPAVLPLKLFSKTPWIFSKPTRGPSAVRILFSGPYPNKINLFSILINNKTNLLITFNW